MLEVKALEKVYYGVGEPLTVLKNLDLAVQRSEMVGIVGDSGAGKTTLLYILGALERPTGGRVTFEDEEVFPVGIGDEDLARFRNRKVGFVFQFHGLITEFNALENAMMPALIAGRGKAEAADLGRKALVDIGLGERMHHKPGELSGGEQQRVAFARALVMQPDLVLADEPTGNLDVNTGERLWEIMFEINARKGTTFIVVTHNERLARRMPRLLRLTGGRLETLR